MPGFYRVTAESTLLLRMSVVYRVPGFYRVTAHRSRLLFVLLGVPSAWILQGYSVSMAAAFHCARVYRVPGFYRVTACAIHVFHVFFVVYRVPGFYRVTAYVAG